MRWLSRWLLLSLLSTTACRSSVTPRPLAEEAPPPSTPSEPVKPELPCTRGALQFEPWLSEGLLMFGEFHGTQETAPAVEQALCTAAAEGKPTWIALEIPEDEQQRLDTFLSTGEEAPLLEGNFWRRDYQDGRSSQAMLGLLREVRRLRLAGLDLHVLTMDVPSSGEGSHQDRDEHMAARVAQVRTQFPTQPMVLLVGNFHASRRLKIPRAMGWRLTRQGLTFKNLLITSSGGSAWMCGATCGPNEFHGEDLGPEPRILEAPEAKGAGYDALLYLGHLSISPPAWTKP